MDEAADVHNDGLSRLRFLPNPLNGLSGVLCGPEMRGERGRENHLARTRQTARCVGNEPKTNCSVRRVLGVSYLLPRAGQCSVGLNQVCISSTLTKYSKLEGVSGLGYMHWC